MLNFYNLVSGTLIYYYDLIILAPHFTHMELAIKIHNCLTNGTSSHELLNIFSEIKDKNILAQINEYFMENYNQTPHEFIAEKFEVDEVYAIDSALKCIREPIAKNIKKRNAFFEKIGYSQTS